MSSGELGHTEQPGDNADGSQTRAAARDSQARPAGSDASPPAEPPADRQLRSPDSEHRETEPGESGPAEPRTRDEYASDTRDAGRPMSPDSGDSHDATPEDEPDDPAGDRPDDSEPGPAEPRDRQAYADHQRAGPEDTALEGDQAAETGDPPAASFEESGINAAELRTRDEYADAMCGEDLPAGPTPDDAPPRDSDGLAAEHDEIRASELHAGVVTAPDASGGEARTEHDPGAIPGSAGEADGAGDGASGPDAHSSGAGPDSPDAPGGQPAEGHDARQESAADRGREPPGRESPGEDDERHDVLVMVGGHPVHVVEAGRTLNDDKPTGIGLKPDGTELREMESSEKLSRADAFRKVIRGRADDLTDVISKDVQGAKDILTAKPPPGKSEAPVRVSAPERPGHGIDAGNLATAGVALALVADRAIEWGMEQWRTRKEHEDDGNRSSGGDTARHAGRRV